MTDEDTGTWKFKPYETKEDNEIMDIDMDAMNFTGGTPSQEHGEYSLTKPKQQIRPNTSNLGISKNRVMQAQKEYDQIFTMETTHNGRNGKFIKTFQNTPGEV